MKNSLLIVFFLLLGIAVGQFQLVPEFLLKKDLSTYALYILLILVGISVGMDKNSFALLKRVSVKILFVPLATILGTWLGVSLVSLFFTSLSLSESLAVGSGFGYYSLSSILIAKIHSDELGMIALLSNILREITTLLLTPIFVKIFGKLSPISSAGATSMDTTLPIISQYSGKEFVVISVLHGLILTILVPLFVVFFLKS